MREIGDKNRRTNAKMIVSSRRMRISLKSASLGGPAMNTGILCGNEGLRTRT